MADCFIRDDCSIRVYRSISYTRVQKSGQAIAGLPGANKFFFGQTFNLEKFSFIWIIKYHYYGNVHPSSLSVNVHIPHENWKSFWATSHGIQLMTNGRKRQQ